MNPFKFPTTINEWRSIATAALVIAPLMYYATPKVRTLHDTEAAIIKDSRGRLNTLILDPRLSWGADQYRLVPLSQEGKFKLEDVNVINERNKKAYESNYGF